MGGGSTVVEERIVNGRVTRAVTQLDGNSKLTQFGIGNLEDAVDSAYQSVSRDISRGQIGDAAVILNCFFPGTTTAIYAAEVTWRHRSKFIDAAQSLGNIWVNDETPVTEKVVHSANMAGKTLVEIVKAEGESFVKKKLPGLIADGAIELLEEHDIPAKLTDDTPFEGFTPIIKEMISTTIQNISKESLERWLK